MRIASYAPFTVTVCFNGHNFVAQQLRNRSIQFQMRDNLFVSVDDMPAFRRAVAALAHQAIARFCDHWVYRCINLFPPSIRRKGFRYQWYIDQVERCHNLLFSSPDRRNALFGRLLDTGRAIGQPHVISRLFQRRLQAHRTGGRMQQTPADLAGHDRSDDRVGSFCGEARTAHRPREWTTRARPQAPRPSPVSKLGCCATVCTRDHRFSESRVTHLPSKPLRAEP